MTLPLDLQAKLNSAVNSYSGVNIEGKSLITSSKTDANIKNIAAPAPDETMNTQLASSFNRAISRDWGIQRQTSPLSAEQIVFLRSHTLDEIVGTMNVSKENPLLDFCVGILKNVAIQIASTAVTQAFSEKRTEDSIEKPSQRSIASKGEIQFEPDAPSTADSTKKDPSIKTMEKIAASRAKGLATKMATQTIEDKLKSLGNSTENELFIKHAKTTVGAAVTTGNFLTKVEELGWQAASADLAKKVTIDFIAKHSSKMITGAVGCMNPVWCASILTKVIVDTFEPTETAPPSHDMRQPLPPPSLNDVTRSRLPHLDPIYPSIQKFD